MKTYTPKVKDTSFAIKLAEKLPIADELAARVREKILSGELPPGTKLPTTQQLAAQWGTYVPAVHAALASLTKEGLLDRRCRKGTFVREPENRLSRVGILAPNQMWADASDLLFIRASFLILQDYLLQQNIHVSVWFENRMGDKSNTPLAPLLKAVKKQEIQALIALNAGKYNAGWLNELPIPVTGFSGFLRNHARFDFNSFFELSLKALSEAGCRSVALISAMSAEETCHYQAFHQAVKKMKMQTHERWVRNGWTHPLPHDEFGYEQVRELWSQPEKPDGLIVYPDTVARGAMLGISTAGIRVPDDLCVVFHRNAEVLFLCPLAVTFVESSARDCVEAFHNQLTRIYVGEANPVVTLNYHLSRAKNPASAQSPSHFNHPLSP